MELMEAHLKRWKYTALEIVSLQEKTHSIRARKNEWEGFSHKFLFHFLSHLLSDRSSIEIYLDNLSM